MPLARRILAAVLSLAAPGAGHAVLGRTRRGLLWLAASALAMMLIAASPWGLAAVVAVVIGCASDAFAVGPREGAPGPLKGLVLTAAFFLAGQPAKLLQGRYLYSIERVRADAGPFVAGDFVVVRRAAPARGEVALAGDRFAEVVALAAEGLPDGTRVPGDQIALRDATGVVTVPVSLVRGRVAYVLFSFDAEGKLKPGRTGTR